MLIKIRFFAVFLILSVFSCIEAFSFSISNILESQEAAKLENQINLERYVYKEDNIKPSLTPDTPLCKKASESWSNEQDDPVFLVEEIFILPKDKIGSGDASKTTIDFGSKVLRSVSKMEGMKYLSNSSKKLETLYSESYCIAGPKDRTRVEDDIAGSAEGKIVYCMHKDNSFGRINYKVNYHQRPDEMSASFVNTTPVKVGPIKAIEEGNLRMDLVLIDCEDKMMMYMIVQSKFPAIKFLEDTMYASFKARLNAIFDWFVAQF